MSTFCQFHPSQPGTHQCALRKEPLCSRCAAAFTVDYEKNACHGLPICPDCLKEMVKGNAEELNKNTKTIKRDFIISLVGIVIGAILGFCVGIAEGFGTALILALVFAGIGGMFLSFVKFYFSMVWEGIKALFAFDGVVALIIAFVVLGFNMLIGVVKCIFYTIRNTYEYITYLRDTADILKTDAEAVQWVDAYLAYTASREANPATALDVMMSEGGSLHGNIFAECVANAGEEAAIRHVQSNVTLVAMSYEIVHDFGD